MSSETNISLACFLLAAATPALAEWPEAKVMPLGDSITRGTNDINYPNGSIPGGYRKGLGQSLANASLEHDFVGEKTDNAAPDMDPDHNGLNGYRTDEILANLPQWLQRNPDIVLLKAGTNDILQDRPVETAAANLSALIEAITNDAPNRYLYVSTVLPVTQAWEGRTAVYLNGKADAYNTKVRNLVSQFAGQGRKVKLVDTNANIVLTPVPGDPSQNFFQTGDGIHPGQAGYNQMGQIWFSAVTANDSYFQNPPPGAPGTPGTLSAAVISDSKIRLNWADNSIDETGFKVERKTGASGVFEQISILPPDSTNFQDSDLSNDTNYIYRVRAINSISNSPYSNESGATTSPTVDYGAWALRHPAFSALAAEDQSPAADPNQDGINNLLCYAFNLDPLAPVPVEDQPCIRWVAGEAENEFFPWFQYRRSKTAEVSMELQVSMELTEDSWEVNHQEDATIDSIPGDDVTEQVSVPLPTGLPNHYARLKVMID